MVGGRTERPTGVQVTATTARVVATAPGPVTETRAAGPVRR